jgi:A/G-specific adenine glycosylase
LDLSIPLLRWYDRHRRSLPWRETRDPYAIWVSEIMLQQTQVKTVIPYFERWMARFPTVCALATAAEDDVLHAWQGLGYYSRARSLKRAAELVLERFQGELPRAPEDLRALPGVGPYSAGAIASIAFGERVPVVDGNVIRVLTRLFGLRGDPTRAPLKAELWRRAEGLVPRKRPGDFNQALMELGATVCTPEAPGCDACPLAAACEARARGMTSVLPDLPPRAKPTEVAMVAAVVERRGRVLVLKRPADAARWPSMWQFPSVELEPREAPERGAERAVRQTLRTTVQCGELLGSVRHSVTRYRITLRVYRCRVRNDEAAKPPIGQAKFVAAAELAELAMPAAHRRIARLLEDPLLRATANLISG